MTAAVLSGSQFVAGAAAVCVYSLLVHYANFHPAARWLGALLTVLPLLVIAIAAAWRSLLRWPLLLVCVVATGLAWQQRGALAQHYTVLIVVQQCVSYLLLAWLFGRTLQPGRTPLCTTFAALVQSPASEQVLRYTRSVTLAWTVFFLVIAVATVALYLLGSLQTWSLFSNFGPLVLLPLMFLGEYAVRRRTLPPAYRNGVFEGVRAYLQGRAG